jgi:hypothetical protein
MDRSRNALALTAVAAVASESQSMQKLQQLKEKIQAELEVEQKARAEEAGREPMVPLSLAPDYATGGGPNSPGAAGRRNAKARSAAGGKQPSGGSPVKVSEGQAAVALAREKIAGMKLDKWVQRELDAELERQSVETSQLKSQNARLRDIVALRQQSNARREASMQSEISRLNKLCDDTCVDVTDMDKMMVELRSMNTQIQQGAEQLKASIEDQAETERLQLVRNYRVKIREVKQLLHEQEQRNLEGAKVWIERHRVLERDRDKAAEALSQLEVRNERLEVQNRELEVMLKHQSEQRDGMTTRVAVVKRENKRLQEHIAAMEAEQLRRGKEVEGSPARGGAHDGATGLGRDRLGSIRATSHTRSSQSKLHGAALAAEVKKQRRIETLKADPDAQRSAAAHQEVLKKLRRALDQVRAHLRQVRSAHVELLQERTELEVFMRQCMEDVRRDMYRFTVVSNAGKLRGGDGTERVLENYSAAERRELLAILQSKLRVFATLHAHMFPAKAEVMDGLGLATRGGEAVLSAEDELTMDRALGAEEVVERRRLDALAAGHLPLSRGSAGADDGSGASAVDSLWAKWRKWTTEESARR